MKKFIKKALYEVAWTIGCAAVSISIVAFVYMIVH